MHELHFDTVIFGIAVNTIVVARFVLIVLLVFCQFGVQQVDIVGINRNIYIGRLHYPFADKRFPSRIVSRRIGIESKRTVLWPIIVYFRNPAFDVAFFVVYHDTAFIRTHIPFSVSPLRVISCLIKFGEYDEFFFGRIRVVDFSFVNARDARYERRCEGNPAVGVLHDFSLVLNATCECYTRQCCCK